MQHVVVVFSLPLSFPSIKLFRPCPYSIGETTALHIGGHAPKKQLAKWMVAASMSSGSARLSPVAIDSSRDPTDALTSYRTQASASFIGHLQRGSPKTASSRQFFPVKPRLRADPINPTSQMNFPVDGGGESETDPTNPAEMRSNFVTTATVRNTQTTSLSARLPQQNRSQIPGLGDSSAPETSLETFVGME